MVQCRIGGASLDARDIVFGGGSIEFAETGRSNGLVVPTEMHHLVLDTRRAGLALVTFDLAFLAHETHQRRPVSFFYVEEDIIRHGVGALV